MPYFASIGPKQGEVRYCVAGDTAKVLSGLASDSRTIGRAVCLGCDDRGRSIWRLTIRGHGHRARWLIVDRKFRPAE